MERSEELHARSVRLQTERLELVPLTALQLRKWLEHPDELERELMCSYRAEPLTGFFREIVEQQLCATRNDLDRNYVWHSFWFLIRRYDRVVVGSADFKDVPDAHGEVEIGYGLGDGFCKNGYMTEAVRAMCEWAFSQSGVKQILAETEPDNGASQRVLLRCGFREISRGETIHFCLQRDSEPQDPGQKYCETATQ